jgi:type I restriction enzyme R subunit
MVNLRILREVIMRGKFRRRQLPHWDIPGATYFITACLNKSLPAQGVVDLRNLEDRLRGQQRPAAMSEKEWQNHKWKLIFRRCDEWLDTSPQVSHLRDERLARVVQDSLYFFAGEHYDLIAYVIMPSHFHWLFRPSDVWVAELGDLADERSPRERIMHSVQSYSGRTCNGLLRETGPFWQTESYDHVVRDEEELERIRDYIELNPVHRGWVTCREQWRFSSAFDRNGLRQEELSQSLTKELLQKARDRPVG